MEKSRKRACLPTSPVELKMRILLSAYACAPGRGSEPGVGWNWTLELVRLGHEISVLTRRNNREAIEAFFRESPAARKPHFVYYDLPAVILRLKRMGLLPVQIYYFLWQMFCVRAARVAIRDRPIDLVWHLTFGVLRQPSFLWLLHRPFVFGPVGGGERAPLRLRGDYNLREYIRDISRDALNGLVSFDPFMRLTFAKALLILTKTPDSARYIPRRWHAKTKVYLEVGVAGTSEGKSSSGKLTRLLYVGRFLHLKGFTIVIRAFAEFVRLGGVGRLTLVGNGPCEPDARALGKQLGIADLLDWISWIDHGELGRIYASHDIFLFPSLRDSSGNVVVEALAQGLPVVCLDLGGPAQIVTAESGVVVPTEGQTPQGVAADLGRRIKHLSEDEAEMRRLSAGALLRAHDFLWAIRVRKALEIVQQSCPFLKAGEQ
jgi:glycosyltransferase involved in cell wall biosynthesis